MSEEKVVLEKRIVELEDKLERVHQVVYQLLGGLFFHENQETVLGIQTDYLFGTDENKLAANGTDNWWPTTKQCDDNTERLEVLEKRLESLEKTKYEYEETREGQFETVPTAQTSWEKDWNPADTTLTRARRRKRVSYKE